MNKKRTNGFRRIFAVALAAVLTVSLTPVSAMAASDPLPEMEEIYEAPEEEAAKEEIPKEETLRGEAAEELPEDVPEETPEEEAPAEDPLEETPEEEAPGEEIPDETSKEEAPGEEPPEEIPEEEAPGEEPPEETPKEETPEEGTAGEIPEEGPPKEEASEEVPDGEATEEEILETAADEALGKVEGLRLGTDEEGADNSALLSWDGVQNSEMYEIRLTDADGREYARDYSYDESGKSEEFLYASTGDTIYNLRDLAGVCRAYQRKPDGLYEEAQSDGEPVYVSEGGAYTVYVRAVAAQTADENGNGLTCGEWSDGLEIVIPAAAAAEEITNVKLCGEDSDPYISFTFGAGNDYAEVEIKDEKGRSYCPSAPITDSDGTEKDTYQKLSSGVYSLKQEDNALYSWVKNADDGNYEPEHVTNADGTKGEILRAFGAGQTYTIRLRGVVKTAGQNPLYSDWTEALVYTVPEEDGPEAVSNVRYVPEYDRISWNESGNADGYEVELKDSEASYNTCPKRVWDKKQQMYIYDFSEYIVRESWNYLSTSEAYYKWMMDPETDTPVHEKDPEGAEYKAFRPGNAYTVKVRAYSYPKGTDASEKSSSARLYSDWTEAYSFTIPSDQPAIEKVTGVKINSENVTWEEESNADRLLGSYKSATTYQIEIKDENGRIYGRNAKAEDEVGNVIWDDDKQYYSVDNSTIADMGDLSELCTYVEDADSAGRVIGYIPAVHTSGQYADEYIKAFEAGGEYTVRIRAMRTYDGQASYGEWSDAVSYKPPAAVALTDLQYVKEDRSYYYFTYKTTLDRSASTIYYQAASDADFIPASVVIDWTAFQIEEDLLRIPKGGRLEKNRTYYVRAVNYANNNEKGIKELTEAEIDALMPSSTSFTTETVRTPKNITGFRLYKEEEQYYEFRFDPVLSAEDGDLFELQISQEPNGGDWKSVDLRDENDVRRKEARLYKDQLNEGTTYVRARAYVTQKNEKTGKEEKVYGAPSGVLSVTIDKATSSIHNLKLAEQTDSEFVFSFSGDVDKQQYVEYQYSESGKFNTDKKYNTYTSGKGEADEINNQFRIGFSRLTAGRKYYVRARVINENAESQEEACSAYTNVVKITTAIPEVSVRTASVTRNSITLRASAANNDRYLSGYEIQRKEGKSWKTAGKTSDSTYTDTKLKQNTTYSYRVRPYFYNTNTKKTANGKWAYAEGTTWSGALKLKAEAKSKTSVKLSWSRVSDAEGYEIYRCLGSYSSTEISTGEGNAFDQFKLVKSADAGTRSYTDKKLTGGMDYTYLVAAYKTIDGSKVIIQESAKVSLGWKMTQSGWVRKSNGKVTWSWNPVYGAKGYLVERNNRVTGKWSVYKRIKNAKTKSVALPRTTDENGVKYRVRAYNGKKYTKALEQTVYPVLAAPGSVKAKASSANGSVTITWKKVKGADYYKVYRTTDSWSVYNKDVKGYEDLSDHLTPVVQYVKDSSKVSGYRPAALGEMNGNKLVDKKITYVCDGVENTVYEGPKSGVTYYYYVVAYKNGEAYNYGESGQGSEDGTGRISSLYSKAARAVVKPKNVPEKVTISSVKAAGGKVTVKYKKVKGAEGYEILRSTSRNKDFEVAGTAAGGKKVSYVDKGSGGGLTKGVTYYYKVRAFIYNDAGLKEYGQASAVKQVKFN